MKAYQVVLTKSFVVTVNAVTSKEAKRVCVFYTSNIQDISTDVDRQNEKFEIENIECTLNETFECNEIEMT